MVTQPTDPNDLPPGTYIFTEYKIVKDVIGIFPWYHSYLVLVEVAQDGTRTESVLRGGAVNDFDFGILLSTENNDQFDLINIETGDLADSTDARGDLTPTDRHAYLLDLNGADPLVVWALMTQVAVAISQSNIDYNLIPPQNSNSVISAILSALGIPLDQAFHPDLDLTHEVPGIANNLAQHVGIIFGFDPIFGLETNDYWSQQGDFQTPNLQISYDQSVAVFSGNYREFINDTVLSVFGLDLAPNLAAFLTDYDALFMGPQSGTISANFFDGINSFSFEVTKLSNGWGIYELTKKVDGLIKSISRQLIPPSGLDGSSTFLELTFDAAGNLQIQGVSLNGDGTPIPFTVDPDNPSENFADAISLEGTENIAAGAASETLDAWKAYLVPASFVVGAIPEQNQTSTNQVWLNARTADFFNALESGVKVIPIVEGGEIVSLIAFEGEGANKKIVRELHYSSSTGGSLKDVTTEIVHGKTTITKTVKQQGAETVITVTHEGAILAAGGIGQVLGSTLGKQLAGDSQIAQVLAGSVKEGKARKWLKRAASKGHVRAVSLLETLKGRDG